MAIYIPGCSGCNSECFLCGLDLDTSGGEAGYDHTFSVTSDFVNERDIYVDFECYTIKDKLLIDADGSNVYDSTCIAGNVTPTVTIPAGTDAVRIQVVPHCDPGQPGTTIWTLAITCEAI